MENAERDNLTGALTRKMLLDHLPLEIENAQRTETPFSILFLDLDHFKSINDGFGHGRGDEILSAVVKRMTQAVRASDMVYRQGGDEFIILLPGTHCTQAEKLAARILSTVQEKEFAGNPPISLGLSIGVASYPADADSVQGLLEVADQRHYAAKRNGRGRVIGHDILPNEISISDSSHRLLERDAALATAKQFLNQFFVYHSGVLEISGDPGCGKSRLLEKIENMARLQGYTVLKLQGGPGMARYYLGSIVRACRAFAQKQADQAMPHPALGVSNFLAWLTTYQATSKTAGVLFLVDDFDQIDKATCDFLLDLLLNIQTSSAETTCEDAETGRAGLIYTIDTRGIRHLSFHGIHLRNTLHIRPLNIESTRIWIRQSLQWEPTSAFLTWFYAQTKGLPKQIQIGLSFLVSQTLLQRQPGTWQPSRHLFHLDISAQLQQQTELEISNFPTYQRQFIGRHAEIEKLHKNLNTYRNTAILGAGGVGKTRLAIQVGLERAGLYPDGVYFVDFSDLTDNEYLETRLLQTFHIFGRKNQSIQESLIDSLKNKTALVIFDIFQPIQGFRQLVDAILTFCPNVQMLMALRQNWEDMVESHITLAGLGYPEVNNLEHLTTYHQFSSIQLFLQHAQSVSPDFAPNEVEIDDLILICNYLAGLPLAIELAATWVNVYSCQEIYREIAEIKLRNLNKPSQLSDQYQHMLAVMDSFWMQLSDLEQQILMNLAVFRGSFQSQAAQQIAGASPFFLDALAMKSYLRINQAGHYIIHSLLQQYAIDRLRANPKQHVAVMQRFATYYHKYLLDRKNHYYTIKGAKELHGEIENIRRALHWLIQNQQYQNIGAAIFMLHIYFYFQGLLFESKRFMEKTISYFESAAQPELMGITLGCLGYVSFLIGDAAKAAQQIEQAITLLQQTQNFKMRVYFDGLRFYFLQDLDAIQANLQHALTIFQNTEDELMLGLVYDVLADINRHRGQIEQANHYYQKSVLAFQQVRAECIMPHTLGTWGNMLRDDGQFEQARSRYAEAKNLYEKMGNPTWVAMSDFLLGSLSCREGHYTAAKNTLINALTLLQRTGYTYGMMHVKKSLGDCYLGLDDLEQARSHYFAALAYTVEGEFSTETSLVLTGLARLYWAERQTAIALEMIRFIQENPRSYQHYRQLAAELRTEIDAELQQDLFKIEAALPQREITTLCQELGIITRPTRT